LIHFNINIINGLITSGQELSDGEWRLYLIVMNTEVLNREFLQKEENTAIEKERLLRQSELSIWLDTYDDIFSDFDSRPFSERALSDDFISEAKKMVKEKRSGAISLKLLMPTQQRDKKTEDTIIKSLRVHFRTFASQLQEEMKQKKKQGLLLITGGIIIIICTAFLANISTTNFFINALRIILEPAGWFFTWTGFDHVFYLSRNKKPELDFLSRMGHAEIKFLSF
jgi:hypothetical protein